MVIFVKVVLLRVLLLHCACTMCILAIAYMYLVQICKLLVFIMLCHCSYGCCPIDSKTCNRIIIDHHSYARYHGEACFWRRMNEIKEVNQRKTCHRYDSTSVLMPLSCIACIVHWPVCPVAVSRCLFDTHQDGPQPWTLTSTMF
jgi:hypothetical protein